MRVWRGSRAGPGCGRRRLRPPPTKKPPLFARDRNRAPSSAASRSRPVLVLEPIAARGFYALSKSASVRARRPSAPARAALSRLLCLARQPPRLLASSNASRVGGASRRPRAPASLMTSTNAAPRVSARRVENGASGSKSAYASRPRRLAAAKPPPVAAPAGWHSAGAARLAEATIERFRRASESGRRAGGCVGQAPVRSSPAPSRPSACRPRLAQTQAAIPPRPGRPRAPLRAREQERPHGASPTSPRPRDDLEERRAEAPVAVVQTRDQKRNKSFASARGPKPRQILRARQRLRAGPPTPRASRGAAARSSHARSIGGAELPPNRSEGLVGSTPPRRG